LSGEIDYAASLEIGPAIARTAGDCGSAVSFDLGDVTLLDSEGIKMLLTAFATVDERDGHARITRCSECAKRTIKLARLDQILTM